METKRPFFWCVRFHFVSSLLPPARVKRSEAKIHTLTAVAPFPVGAPTHLKRRWPPFSWTVSRPALRHVAAREDCVLSGGPGRRVRRGVYRPRLPASVTCPPGRNPKESMNHQTPREEFRIFTIPGCPLVIQVERRNANFYCLLLSKDTVAPHWLEMKATHWGKAAADARMILRGLPDMLAKLTPQDAAQIIALSARLVAKN
jgi:hypothetical protein